MSAHGSTVQLNRSFRRGFTLTFTADLATKAFSAVTVVVLIRGLTVSVYAYTTLFLTLAQFAGSAAGGGVRTRYLREEAESRSRATKRAPDLFATALLKGTLLIAAAGLCSVPLVGRLHLGAKFGAGPGLILYSAAFAAGYAATELVIAHNQAGRRFGRAGALSVIRAGVLLAAAVFVSFTHQDPVVLSISFVAAMALVGLAAAVPLVVPALRHGSFHLRSLWLDREERRLTLYYLASAGFAYVDVLVASAILGQRQVATLGAALRYLTIVLAAAPSLAAILRVRTAQVDIMDSRAAQRKMLVNWMRSGGLPVGIGLVVLVAIVPWAIPILDGGRYPESVPVLQILLVMSASAYLTAPVVSVLMAQLRYGLLALVFAVGLALNFAGDVLVAPRFGVLGIAVVSTSAYVGVDLGLTVAALRYAAPVQYPRPPRGPRRAPAPVRLLELMVTSVIAMVIALVVVGGVPSHFFGSTRSPAPARARGGPLSPRWYAATSPWNTPIPADPRIAPNNASLIAALAASPAIGVSYNYTPAIWYANRHTPEVPVRIDHPGCDSRTVMVPIPTGAIPDPSSEGHMIVAQYGTNREYDFYQAQSPGQTPKGPKACPTTNEWTATKVVTTNWRTGSGELHGAPRGSGTASGSGVILPRDTQMPAGSTWHHALAASYRNTCSQHESWCPIVAPATDEDGTCTDQATCLPEGARLQLDPSLDCSTLPSLRAVWQRQMCRTLQVYGVIIIDTNAAGPTIANQWRGSLRGYTWPWLRENQLNLPRSLLSDFRVLAWR